MSEQSTDATEQMPAGDIDLTLTSTTTPWGPLACIGHEGGVAPGDWWGAFWWSMEQRWQSIRAEQSEPEEPETEQTTLRAMTDGGQWTDESKHPDYDGMMTADPDEGEEVWVHTSQVLGEVEGEKIDEYAKIRVLDKRTVYPHDTGEQSSMATEQDGGRDA